MTPELELALDRRDSQKKLKLINAALNGILLLQAFLIGVIFGAYIL